MFDPFASMNTLGNGIFPESNVQPRAAGKLAAPGTGSSRGSSGQAVSPLGHGQSQDGEFYLGNLNMGGFNALAADLGANGISHTGFEACTVDGVVGAGAGVPGLSGIGVDLGSVGVGAGPPGFSVGPKLVGLGPLMNPKPERNLSMTTNTSYPSEGSINLEGTHERRKSYQSQNSDVGSMDLNLSNEISKVNLNVKCCGNSSLNDTNPKFEVYVSNGYSCWDVVRKFEEFKMLAKLLESKGDVSTKYSLPPLYGPTGLRSSMESLVDGLNNFMAQVSSHLPNVMEPHFVDFIAAHKYLFMSFMQVGTLQRTVNNLESTVVDLSMQMKNSGAITQMLLVSNRELTQRIQALESCMISNMSQTRNNAPGSAGNGHLVAASVSASKMTLDERIISESAAAVHFDSNQSEQRSAAVEASPPMGGGGLNRIWNFTDMPVEEEALAVKQAVPQPPECKRLFQDNVEWAAELITTSTEPTSMDAEIDEVMGAMWPLRTQTAHRSSVQDFTVKMVKSVLNLRAYATGMCNLDCFLPDDPLCIVVFSNARQSLDHSWCLQLAEPFRSLSDGSLDNMADGLEGMEGRELSNHSVKNVHITQEEPAAGGSSSSFSLRTSVDNIDIDIRMGNHSELLLTSLIEEISALVGKDHLLKRTWLLLSAWWKYEVTADQQAGLVTENELAVMLCAIFNQHYARIHFPLQALGIFFAEYVGLDLASFVITLYGVYPVAALENGSICARPEHLVSAEHLDQYCKWYTSATTNESAVAQSTVEGFGSSQSMSGSSTGGVFGRHVAPIEAAGSSNNFLVGAVNISHPLCVFENMAVSSTGAVSAKAAALAVAINHGAVALQAVLEAPQEGSVKAFFRESWTRFSGGFRPDVGSLHDICMPSAELRCSFDVNLERLLEEVSYANMTIAGDVSERGFKLLFREMLTERGALPVGEIGKMLQESTGFSTVTTSLKSIYGGLKKFLEKCDDEFLIGKNHPFNPHVYLLKYLNQKELQIIADGGILVNYMAKFKKKQAQRRRSGTQQHFAGSGGGGGYIHGGHNGHNNGHNSNNGHNGNNGHHAHRRTSIPPVIDARPDVHTRRGSMPPSYMRDPRDVHEFVPSRSQSMTQGGMPHGGGHGSTGHFDNGGMHNAMNGFRRGKRSSYPDGRLMGLEPSMGPRSHSDKSKGSRGY